MEQAGIYINLHYLLKTDRKEWKGLVMNNNAALLTVGQIKWRQNMIMSYSEKLEKVYSPNIQRWLITRIRQYQLQLTDHYEAQTS